MQQILRSLEGHFVRRVRVLDGEVGEQGQRAALRQEAVGRDAHARTAQHQNVVLQIVALGQDKLADDVHRSIIGRKLHTRYLDVHRRTVDVLRQCQRHVQTVHTAHARQAQQALARLDAAIILLQVHLLRQVPGLIHTALLQIIGTGQLAVAYQIVYTPVAEQLVHALHAALLVLGIAFAHTFVDAVVGINLQSLELDTHHRREAQRTPRHTPFAGEARFARPLDFVDCQLILSDADHLSFQFLGILLRGNLVFDGHLAGTLEIFLHQVLGHGKVGHVYRIGSKRNGGALALGLHTQHEIVGNVHLLLDVLPRDDHLIIVVLAYLLDEDWLSIQSGFPVDDLPAIEQLHLIAERQRIRLLALTAEVIDAIPTDLNVLAHKTLARRAIIEDGAREPWQAVGVGRVRVEKHFMLHTAEDAHPLLVSIVCLHFLRVVCQGFYFVGRPDTEHLQVALAVVLQFCIAQERAIGIHAICLHTRHVRAGWAHRREHLEGYAAKGHRQPTLQVNGGIAVDGRSSILPWQQLHHAERVFVSVGHWIAGHHGCRPRELGRQRIHIHHLPLVQTESHTNGRQETWSLRTIADGEVALPIVGTTGRQRRRVGRLMPAIGCYLSLVETFRKQAETAANIVREEIRGSLNFIE